MLMIMVNGCCSGEREPRERESREREREREQREREGERESPQRPSLPDLKPSQSTE